MSSHRGKRLYWQTRHNTAFTPQGSVNRKSLVIYRKRKDRSGEEEKCCFCGREIGKRILILGDHSAFCTPCARNLFALVTVWLCTSHEFMSIPDHPEYEKCADCPKTRLRPDVADFRAEQQRKFDLDWSFMLYAE